MTALSRSARRVQEELAARGMELEVVELPASTRTAREAAEAVGCEVAQIAKSIVLRTASGGAVLVIASGTRRIDLEKVSSHVGEGMEMADPDFVRRETGFAIGGVPPVGHQRPLTTLIDRNLLDLDRIWAAAGTPHAVFSLDPRHLAELTGGTVADVC